ncbi:transcription termination factor 1-like isoform X4 [Sceloporus undulatus]|uniref:transcription termination factor 1-like isoform X4 n=1 Tax=Sceloporus undulatus TaxID=8520 RepID=UPI001C4D267D|nr:transcription termination factor 1-like isoform X4 [Sceloporus undulatus]
MNEKSVNSHHPSLSSDPSFVFLLHVDSQDTEESQTEQQKSKRCKKDTRETSDSQLQTSWVVKESNQDDAVGTVTLKKKRKRKHRFSEQDDVSECYIPETPEEASSLPEADYLEEVGGSCEITTKKKEEEKIAKILSKDGLLVKDNMEAGGKYGNSQQYHVLQKSRLSEPEELIRRVRTLSDSAQKEEGISVRFGRFSKQENELLRKNMEAFLEESGISSAEKLLFSDRFPEEHAHLTRLKRDSLFGLKIAQGIPRPWRLVYYRAKKMFDPRNYNGKYSKKETENLKKYQSLHGNEWKKMSELMNRSSHSLHLKYDEMKSKFNSGAWSKEEIKKLLDTLKEILWAKVKGLDSTQKPKNTDQAMLLRENLYKGIPWFQVEAKVGTRRWKQCKRKWLYIVTRKMSHGMMKNHGLENLKFKINFIERLYELDVEDIEDVDWDDLSRIIGNVPPDYVRNRFYKIKSMYVPQWRKKTFSEIIDYLHKNILPNLRSKVAGTETKEVATEGGGLKTVFKFNEIFQDDDDLIDDDEDEEEGRNH